MFGRGQNFASALCVCILVATYGLPTSETLPTGLRLGITSFTFPCAKLINFTIILSHLLTELIKSIYGTYYYMLHLCIQLYLYIVHDCIKVIFTKLLSSQLHIFTELISCICGTSNGPIYMRRKGIPIIPHKVRMLY